MRELTYTQALREALTEEMERDPNIILMGEDIGAYGGVFRVTEGLLARFGPERVRDTPISEAGFIGMGVGLAMTGKRPVPELMFMDFALVAADSIWNQAAKMRAMSGGRVKVPMVIRAQQGGGRGNGAQHSQSFEALFTHIPGFKVVLPATPADAKGLLKSALRDENPVMFIEHKLLYNTKGPVPDGEYTIPLGVADVKREGQDLTIVSYSRQLLFALEAAEALQREHGISAEVIDLRCTAPMDIETIVKSLRKTHRLLITHESHASCGVGAEIAMRVMETAFDELDAPIMRVAGLDVPIPVAKTLEDVVLPQPDAIVRGALKLMKE
ncbi:alpha-ketoacid dehydrogenase subunit beta [Candidatus Roseilinea sp. NK_OTU-006]|jgi:pyruvate dehydrogenase E1 component beta subunit|uniref:alpha-ketoacid dehydrogenase subunit beta n=1 Tax=Candidatus Roseilinea sp. NK_OTU-006 TaxID=2704250 RepID=UPI00145DC79E|nr:alpha-ketoacid dehydrogenase subunit beta [Candidatus Roseilinea sp. NK_OTU-006]